jgi:hypothetical protein
VPLARGGGAAGKEEREHRGDPQRQIPCTHAPWVAIPRWNSSTAGTTALICALAPTKRGRVPDHPTAQMSPR